MSSKNTLSLSYKGFGGIDGRKSHSGGKNIYDINNLRITEDGTLEKRCGYYKIISATDMIRDVWGGRINGKYKCYYIVGSSVYLADIIRGKSTLIGTLSEASSYVKFLFYMDSLYLYTQHGFYKVSEDSLSVVLGYVPLYGKNWGCNYPGTINEPLNILNGYARISYKIPEVHSSLLATGRPILRIISVYQNGILLPEDRYYKDPVYNGVNVSKLSEGDEIILTVAFDIEENKYKFLSSSNIKVIGGINDTRLFLWGNTAGDPMYASSFVKPSDSKASSHYFSECSSIYFPENYEFTVGDGRYSIKAIEKHYDRLLIFTEGNTWMINASSFPSESAPITTINSSIGCTSSMGVSSIGNDPVTIYKNGIYRWTSNTDKPDECNAYCISGEISHLLSRNFYKNAKVFKKVDTNELWVTEQEQGGNIFIYNIDKKTWVRYSNVSACDFFGANGNIGFFYNKIIYSFSDSFYDDEGENASIYGIETSITIKNVTFGTLKKKKLLECVTSGESHSGNINFTIKPNTGNDIQFSITQNSQHSAYTKRINKGRFVFIKEMIIQTSPEDSARHKIHDLEFTAK